MSSDDHEVQTPHCGRRLPNPWWTAVTTETSIALYEGASDARKLRWVIKNE